MTLLVCFGTLGKHAREVTHASQAAVKCSTIENGKQVCIIWHMIVGLT